LPLTYRNLPNSASFPRPTAEPIRILMNCRDYALRFIRSFTNVFPQGIVVSEQLHRDPWLVPVPVPASRTTMRLCRTDYPAASRYPEQGAPHGLFQQPARRHSKKLSRHRRCKARESTRGGRVLRHGAASTWQPPASSGREKCLDPRTLNGQSRLDLRSLIPDPCVLNEFRVSGTVERAKR
jgi:hypothetical protein